MVLQPHLTLPVEALNPGPHVEAVVGEDLDFQMIVAPGPVDENVLAGGGGAMPAGTRDR